MRPRTLALLLASALAACTGGSGSREAPDFTLPDLQGRATTLSSQRGKIVLVNFWATWCPTCRDEMPVLEELHRRRAGEGFLVLGVSLDEDRSLVPPFVEKNGITFPVLLADNASVAGFAVRGFPTAFLIGPDGRIERRYAGMVDAKAVENDIVSLLKRRPS